MPDSQQIQEKSFHSLTTEEVSRFFETDLDHGLTDAEVVSRVERYGPNAITKQRGKSVLRLIFAQFTPPLILILIVAGAVTAALEHWIDSGVIFGVVVVNAIVGYIQESKAIKAIEALSKAMTAEATVVRGGQRLRLSAVELVPGDLIILQAGDKVPADLRITYSRELRVDESALTGESVPVDKQASTVDEDTTLADRTNMGYASTLVTGGQGTGVVVGTGDVTEVGKISHLIAEAEVLKTPLTRKIAQFSRLLLYIIVVMAGITFGVGVLRGESAVDMFIAAVALAVGAIPEGLPAAVTIVLAIGVSRMAKRRAIIRRLPAVETLGSTTVICSDKTGTLTENQMTVQRVTADHKTYSLTGAGYDPEGDLLDEDQPVSLESATDHKGAIEELFRAGLLCNDSNVYFEDGVWRISGDPTEAALVVSALKAGLDRESVEHSLPRIDTVPFESEFQYMATLHRDRDSNIIYMKGALERILDRTTHLADGTPISEKSRKQIEHEAMDMASEGLRVLGFAFKRVPTAVEEITHDDVDNGLYFTGLQGMIDPPRVEAMRAIRACEAAGVQVKMITGDHVVTAKAIAKRLQLKRLGRAAEEQPPALTGSELAALDDEQLIPAAEETIVFARVSPEQKLRLVRALQQRRNIVAMTGDGVNDGPALRQADIGVAMGITGTEVAKEASDMVLTDDNFASIEAAVEEGRGVFDNLTKFITWTLPTNVAEGLVIMIAIFAGMALPILPAQILWINMTTAIFLGIALAFEPKEFGIMTRPPRPTQAPILSPALIGRVAMVGLLLVAGVYALFQLELAEGLTLEQARTVAANTIVFGELFYAFNCRSLIRPSWNVGARINWVLLGGVGAMAAAQLLFTYVPLMNTIFQTAPIGVVPWMLILGIGLFVHLVVEFEKWIRRRLEGYEYPEAKFTS